jgi:hypothetical protein
MSNLTEVKPMKELVNNAEWQAVRKSLLGQWKERPVWCCGRLRGYLGPIGSASEDRLRTVMNYLTGSGFRSGRIKHPCISALRAQISAERKKRKFKQN